MDHPLGHLDRRVDACRLGPLGQPEPVVQQHLVRAHLDQERRQPAQIREQGRCQRRARIDRAEIRARHLRDAGAPHDGIGGGLGVVAATAAGEVHPRRDADGHGGQARPAVPQRQQRGDGEPAAGGVARDDEVRGRHALLQEPSIGGHRVVHGRGKRMLGRQAVVEQQRAGAGRRRDGRRQVAVRARRADHVAAAVEIQHDAPGRGRRRTQPFGWGRWRRHALDLDVRRRGKYSLRALVLRAPLGERERVRWRQLREVRAYDLDTTFAHLVSPLCGVGGRTLCDAGLPEIPLGGDFFNAPDSTARL